MKRYRPSQVEIKLLMAAAIGNVPADMVVQHANMVNFYTGEVL